MVKLGVPEAKFGKLGTMCNSERDWKRVCQLLNIRVAQ